MNYQPFHMSRIGAAHIRRERPCQDASLSGSWEDASFAVVADGHGSRQHFRSGRGSEIACRIAKDAIRSFLDSGGMKEASLDERLYTLKKEICDQWISAVLEDYGQFPWTEEELEEERRLLPAEGFEALSDGTDAAIAYGSTLCAVFYDGNIWAAIQLGDGGFIHIGEDGVYEWPMPESLVNEGNRTASLCMQDPLRDFRHCWGTDSPAGLLVYTDGIEKSFPPQGKEIMSFLHWIWRNEYRNEEERNKNLARNLDMLTQRSHIGDDVSVAGLTNPDAEDMEPVAGTGQRKHELERLIAQIREMSSTIEYNSRQLEKARTNRNDVQSGAVKQLEDVIQRKRTARAMLWQQAAAISEELGEFLPPLGPDEGQIPTPHQEKPVQEQQTEYQETKDTEEELKTQNKQENQLKSETQVRQGTQDKKREIILNLADEAELLSFIEDFFQGFI